MTLGDVQVRFMDMLLKGVLEEATLMYPDMRIRFVTPAPQRTYVMPMSDDPRKVAAAWELFLAWLEEGADTQ